MKCPQCGAWNRASMPICVKCGAQLAQETAAEPEWQKSLKDGRRGNQYYRMDDSGQSNAEPDSRDTLMQDMAALKERKESGQRRQRRLREESQQRGSAPSSMTIRASRTAGTIYDQVQPQPEKEVPARRPERTPRTTIRYVGQTGSVEEVPASYDPLWEAQAQRWDRGQLPRQTVTIQLPSRHKRFNRLARVLTVLLILVLVGLVGYFGYHYFLSRRESALEEHQATVVASMQDDYAAHTIMIPGEDGQQIYIRELHTAYVVTDGFATVTIVDHTWYDDKEDVTEPEMDITLTPFLKTASGRQQPLPVITYTIDIPLSPVIKITPETDRIQVASSMYTMQFNVRAGSRVKVNDVDISDRVNAKTGDVSYNFTVQPIGDNVVTLSVRSQYCRENRITMVIYREPQEIPLDMAADTFTSTSSKNMRMRMTTLPGATVDVLTPYTDLDVTKLNTTGEFSFYAVFNHIGDNPITVTSNYPGKKESTIEYSVYYVPSVDDYTRWAWPLAPAEYSELVSNITVRAERQQVYVVTGTLQYFVSEKPQIAVFNTSEDDQSQPVVVQNYTRTTWVKGKYYRLFADVNGSYNTMPWLNARFTYDY